MIGLRLIGILGAAMLVAAPLRVEAHHSAVMFDDQKDVTFEGVVKEFVWRNPHSFLRVDVTDKAGVTKTWALEWGSTGQLAQAKMTRTTLKPGDKLLITGQPSRDSNDDAPRLLLQTVKRVSDGWSWSGRVE